MPDRDDDIVAAASRLDGQPSSQILAQVYENSPIGIALTSPTGILQHPNRAFADMLGFTREELHVKNFADLTHPEDLAASQALVRDLLAGTHDKMRLEKRYLHKDGHPVWVDLTTFLLRDAAGEPLHFVTHVVDISERKNAQRRFEHMFEQSAEGVFLANSAGAYIDANPAALQMMGMTRDELLAVRIPDVVHPEDLQRAPLRSDLLRSGVRLLTTRRMRRKDGSYFYAEIASQAQADGTMIGLVRDVSERMDAERQLQETLQRLSLAQDVAGIGVWELHPATGKVVWDDRMFALFGVTPRYPGGARAVWDERIHPDDRARHEEEVSGCVQVGAELHTEFRVICPDGTVRHLESHARTVYDNDGKASRLVGLNFDVTERRRAEQELRRHRDNLDDLVRERTVELDRSNRELEEFAFVASHDLKEPLRKIQAFGDILTTEYASALPAEGRDYLERMTRTTARLRQMIDSLLALSRVTTRGRPFAMVNCDEIAEQVLSDLGVQIEDSHAEVKLGQLPRVWGDPGQVQQLFQNLISNALKFSRKTVHPLVLVQGNAVGGRARISVTDNGIGVQPVHRERIFGMFQRLNHTSDYDGSGIGLAICRKIAERHGGSIQVADGLDGGVQFTVDLPEFNPDLPP